MIITIVHFYLQHLNDATWSTHIDVNNSLQIILSKEVLYKKEWKESRFLRIKGAYELLIFFPKVIEKIACTDDKVLPSKRYWVLEMVCYTC